VDIGTFSWWIAQWLPFSWSDRQGSKCGRISPDNDIIHIYWICAFWIGLPTLDGIDDNSSRARITPSSHKKCDRSSTVLLSAIIVSDGYVRSWLWKKAAISPCSVQCSASTNYMGCLDKSTATRWLLRAIFPSAVFHHAGTNNKTDLPLAASIKERCLFSGYCHVQLIDCAVATFLLIRPARVQVRAHISRWWYNPYIEYVRVLDRVPHTWRYRRQK
jgi:hypothetical protein